MSISFAEQVIISGCERRLTLFFLFSLSQNKAAKSRSQLAFYQKCSAYFPLLCKSLAWNYSDRHTNGNLWLYSRSFPTK